MKNLPFLVSVHNTFTVVTPDHINNSLFTQFKKHSLSSPSQKTSIKRRMSRIIDLGHGCLWSSFITLTFSDRYYPTLIPFDRFSNYDQVQHYFRTLLKYLNKLKLQPQFKYLAVLEHGGKTNRLHFHMLTNIDYNSPLFIKFRKHNRKIFPTWKYGFSDVAPVNNENCNAVFYLTKYLSKNEVNRTPIGKREVFASSGLAPKIRIITHDIDRYIDGLSISANIGRSLIYVKKGKQK